MSSHFDEKSGLVRCITTWGWWSQTIEEIIIEVNVPEGTVSNDVKCSIEPHSMVLCVHGNDIIKGRLAATILPDDSVWTLEDKKMIRIILVKSGREASKCWSSLLEGKYICDPMTFDQMEKKLTLERFQHENPGFDFSGAEITGNYQKGGPTLTS